MQLKTKCCLRSKKWRISMWSTTQWKWTTSGSGKKASNSRKRSEEKLLMLSRWRKKMSIWWGKSLKLSKSCRHYIRNTKCSLRDSSSRSYNSEITKTNSGMPMRSSKICKSSLRNLTRTSQILGQSLNPTIDHTMNLKEPSNLLEMHKKQRIPQA